MVDTLLIASVLADTPAMSRAPISPFSVTDIPRISNAANAVTQSLGSSRSNSKRHKLTACALTILGLQQLPDVQGTAKQIMAAIEADPTLAQHLSR